MSQILLHGLNVISALNRSCCVCLTKIMEASFRMAQFDHI